MFFCSYVFKPASKEPYSYVLLSKTRKQLILFLCPLIQHFFMFFKKKLRKVLQIK